MGKSKELDLEDDVLVDESKDLEEDIEIEDGKDLDLDSDDVDLDSDDVDLDLGDEDDLGRGGLVQSTSKRVRMIFSVMASPNRIDILRILNSKGPLTYSELKSLAGFKSI